MTIEDYLTDMNFRMIYEKGYNDALNRKERSAIYASLFRLVRKEQYILKDTKMAFKIDK